MPPGLDQLKHIVVLMMENRSFDHMLGDLAGPGSQIDGITDGLFNLDTAGNQVKPQALAQFQGQLDPDPDHHFPGVDLQIFNGDPAREPKMDGFIKSYFSQRRDVAHSQKIMYYFPQKKLPVLTTLAKEFAVFNRWFSSIPGPTICNRAFAHYGTSFGKVGMDLFYINEPFKSIYNRMIDADPKRTAKLYYYDQTSSTMEIVNLLQHQPELFGTYQEFLDACDRGQLPDYSFVEPNYTDHDGDDGALIASDQHPDHHVQAGEIFIASIYNAIKGNDELWKSTALLIVYDEHGGIYDHVPPPACTPDGFVAAPNDTGTGMEFKFDRLGVRVPAILVSPWIPLGTVVTDRIFEHASIPATVTGFFLGDYDQRSPREKTAETFVERTDKPVDDQRNLLSLDVMRDDCPDFDLG